MAQRRKFIFRAPKTQAEAILRRDNAISRLHEVDHEIHTLEAERSDIRKEIEGLNGRMKFAYDQSARTTGTQEKVEGEELTEA
jgi:predicted transcriptional regulator